MDLGDSTYINIINFKEFRVWWRLSLIQINRKDKMLNENVEKLNSDSFYNI